MSPAEIDRPSRKALRSEEFSSQVLTPGRVGDISYAAMAAV